MKSIVYIEISVISYLTARPSRDIIFAAHKLANAEIIKKISKICFEEGYEMPTICTPEELMGE